MKKKLLALSLITIMLVFVFCSCSAEMYDDDEIRAHTVKLLDAIIAENFDAAYSVMSDVCTKQEFTVFYNQMCTELQDVTQYQLDCIGFNTSYNIENGEQYERNDVEYRFKAEGREYVITAVKITGYKNLAGFNLVPIENTELYYNGTLDNMVGATPFQWAMILLNLVVVAVVVLAIVDCSRRNIKKKALWIIIIVLGMLLVGITTAETGNRFNLGLGLFNYSSLIVYGSGKTVLRLLVPVGAIVYFALRKTLEDKEAQQSQEPIYEQQFFAEEANEELTENAPRLYCKKCGAENGASAKYCSKCGEKLTEE